MNTYFMTQLRRNKHLQYRTGAGIVFIAYLTLYILFLYHSHFLPYVFDNNETFSSLVHAQNMYLFGFKYTWGLTDEAYGLVKMAHPYVYTHQGNFPRLYAWILYCFGAKTAESQIFITTFSVGLAGMGFCYHYFAKYVSCLFASIFCLLLMTDYVMFMQWQVNTWRVWHLFFFFSSFLCCHGLNNKHRKFFIIASIVNFACLFYMELSYATFVFLSSSLYSFLLDKCTLRKKCLNVFFLTFGAVLGVGGLVIQNILYLGSSVFLQDMFYTFVARNHSSFSNARGVDQLTQFYTKHHIVFWLNFNTIQGIRGLTFLCKNFYYYCLLPYTPFLTLAALIVMLSTALSCVNQKVSVVLNRQLTEPCRWMIKIKNAAIFYLYLITSATLILAMLYPNRYFSPLVSQMNHMSRLILGGSVWVFFILSTLIFVLVPMAQTLHVRRNINVLVFQKTLPFLGAVFFGFIGAYLIFPGYIVTGYWQRYCVFTVFPHMVLYAWLFYNLMARILNALRGLRILKNTTKKSVILEHVVIYCKSGVSCILLCIFTYYWIQVQSIYLKEFPSTNFNFVNLLQTPLLRGQSIVSNTYAAPFAFLGGTWGYLDPGLGDSKLNVEHHLVLKHDSVYLWLADASKNVNYNKPKLFVCFRNYSFEHLGNRKPRCDDFPLVSFVRNQKDQAPHFKEIADDKLGRDQWSIMRISPLRAVS